jgi:hypothetical protein
VSTKLPMSRALLTIFVTFTLCNWSAGQVLKARPLQPAEAAQPPAEPLPPAQTVDSILLTVPAGTPLKVALDQEIRIRKIGQPVHGKLVEPVYAFDRLVVPAGSEVIGKIAEIDSVSKTKRTLAAMNADFSPPRQVRIEFDELVLTDGRHLPLQTIVSPGSQGVLQFVPANAKPSPSTTEEAKNAASKKVNEIRQEIKKQVDAARQQLHEPGKIHRLERFAVAQLPYHPQYMDSGTGFNADLQQPLSFGSEPLKPESLTSIGNPPPSGSVIHALLLTPLNSASARKGDPVDAIISQPLVVSDQLFLPEGSHIRGSVLQVRAARRLNRNGQLRIVFHEVVPPSGLEEKIEASLEGVEVARGEHLSLDAEGGAQVTTPRTRYLTTAIAVALASSSAAPDHDQGLHGSGGDMGGGAANGFSGLGLVGTLAGALAHSRVVTSGFGFYGAAISVYSHFLARGRDVVYPKDMSMLIGLGIRGKEITQATKTAAH